MNTELMKAIKKTKRGSSHLEEAMMRRLERCPLGKPDTEYRFDDSGRKWRFDFAWPEHRIAVEIDGSVWSGGRHTRGSGFIKDQEKTNKATIMGWSVLRYSGNNMDSVLGDIQSLINRRIGK